MKKQNTAVRRRRFERIVVLVDINAIFRQRECKLYAAHLFNSVARILEQCNEHSKSSTMWGYKFFDPFLPPLRSRSNICEFLGATPISEQFDGTENNLEKFGKVLASMVNTNRVYACYSGGGSRGEYIGRALNEIISDYTWDPLLASDSSSSDEEMRNRGPLAPKERFGDGTKRDSNAIILFSSLPTTWEGVACFLNSPQLVDHPNDTSVPGLLAKTFQPLQQALNRRNIQVCFVDVPPWEHLLSEDRLQMAVNPTPARSAILKGLSDLVHTCIPLDLLAISPTLLPCHLLWNVMADLGFDESGVKVEAHVQCKGENDAATLLCEVQILPLSDLQNSSLSRSSKLLNPIDIVLDSMLPKSSHALKLTSERFLISQCLHPRTPSSSEDMDTLEDNVLQLLQQIPRGFQQGEQAWQLLLITLAREKSVCKVALYNHEDGHFCTAVLEPFTCNSAILTVVSKEISTSNMDMRGSTGIVCQQPEDDKRLVSMSAARKEEPTAAEGVKMRKRSKDAEENPIHAGVTVLPSRKRHKAPRENGIKLEAWEFGYAGDNENPEQISWQVYWERVGTLSTSNEFCSPDCGTLMSKYIEGGKVSQALQTIDTFLKETKENSSPVGSALVRSECTPAVPEQSSKCLTVVDMEPTDRASAPATLPDNSKALVVLGQNIDALAVVGANLLDETKPLTMVGLEVASAQAIDCPLPLALDMTLDEANEYVHSVEKKIVEYLSPMGGNSQKFAETIVHETLKSVYVRLSRKIGDDQKGPVEGERSSARLNKGIAGELKRLLLKTPKKLLAEYKEGGMVDDKIKEHELQILLRLEMISCGERQLIDPKGKDRLEEDICKLLDSIQFHLDGGIFGGKSLQKYCDQLLVNRYKELLPSTIANIYSVMELDGYSELNSAPENTASNLPSRTGGTSLSDVDGAGGSTESASQQENRSGSPHCNEPVHQGTENALKPGVKKPSRNKKSSDDLTLQVRSHLVDKSLMKKGFYHFASGASNLHLQRKFKRGERATTRHSKPFKVPGKSRALSNDTTVQIVCQTPLPPESFMPCISHATDDVSQPPNLIPPLDFTTCSTPEHIKAGVKQSPLAVKGTPLLRTRLTCRNVSKGSLTGSTHSLNKRLAEVGQTAGAVLDSPAPCPSKISSRLFVPEPIRLLLPRDVAVLNQGSSQLSFSALLGSVDISSKMDKARNAESFLRDSMFCNDDDVEDDDEEGILSTPFKVIAPNHSVAGIHLSHLERPNCYKRLGVPTNGNVAREWSSLPHLPAVESMSVPCTTTGPCATAMGQHPSVIFNRRESPEAHAVEHDSGCWSGADREEIPMVHESILPKDYLSPDEPSGKVTKRFPRLQAVVPQSPLDSMNQSSKLDRAPRTSPANKAESEIASKVGDTKENRFGGQKMRSAKHNAGVLQRRNTHLPTEYALLQANLARVQTFYVTRRKRRKS